MRIQSATLVTAIFCVSLLGVAQPTAAYQPDGPFVSVQQRDAAKFAQEGRYVCVDRPVAEEMVTTRFDLLEAYRTYFDKERDDDPIISGISLALDTQKASEGGRSSAFIREIRFYR